MTNKIGIIAIGEKSINILKKLENPNIFDKIAITDKTLEIEEDITKYIQISEDFSLYEDEIQNLFNTYEKIIITVCLGGEFTTEFFKHFAKKISNAAFILSEPLAIEGRKVHKWANQTLEELKQSKNNIILINCNIITTEFIIAANEINAKCDLAFYINNKFLGSAPSLFEGFNVLNKIMSDEICNQIQKSILENNSRLNDEEFNFCKKRLKNFLKENEELNKNTEKLIEKSNAFNYDDNDLENEIWKEYPINKRYCVSNLGRVKYDGKIMHQVDEEGKVGYLILEKSFEDNIRSDYVYNFVAKTFLGKIEGDGFHVHHITNNGYDNSVNNLILLTQKQHSEVHGFEVGYN